MAVALACYYDWVLPRAPHLDPDLQSADHAPVSWVTSGVMELEHHHRARHLPPRTETD